MTAALTEYIRGLSLLQGRPLDRCDLKPLSGLTNHSYRVTLEGEYYVLRLARQGTERYVDRRGEAHNTRVAAELGIAPALCGVDTSTGAQLTRYLPNCRALDHASLGSPQTLAQVVDLLSLLHHSGRRFQGLLRPFSLIDRYLALAGRPGTKHQRALMKWVQRLAAFRARFEELTDDHSLSPCHVDPVPENFLVNKNGLWLIDWEYSAMCEPMWDLSCLAVEAGLDTCLQTNLLRRYYGTTNEARESRFAVYRLLVNVVGLAWTAVQIEQRNSSIDFPAEFQRRQVQTLGLLEEPAVAGGLDALLTPSRSLFPPGKARW